jgi:hypothetical protein
VVVRVRLRIVGPRSAVETSGLVKSGYEALSPQPLPAGEGLLGGLAFTLYPSLLGLWRWILRAALYASSLAAWCQGEPPGW